VIVIIIILQELISKLFPFPNFRIQNNQSATNRCLQINMDVLRTVTTLNHPQHAPTTLALRRQQQPSVSLPHQRQNTFNTVGRPINPFTGIPVYQRTDNQIPAAVYQASSMLESNVNVGSITAADSPEHNMNHHNHQFLLFQLLLTGPFF
jgi:hypothetical protein